MPTKRPDIRLALDEEYIGRYFRAHFREWFPRGREIIGITIAIQRNFLNHFESLAIRYEVRARFGRSVKRLTLRAQARAANHIQVAAPKKTFRAATHLWSHGLDGSMYRPLAYNASGNFFLYEDTPGKSIEKTLFPRYYLKCAPHPPMYILRYVPQVARLLRAIHRVRRLAGVPTVTAEEAQRELNGHFRLIAKHHPPSVAPLRASFRRLRASHPDLDRELSSPTRRRLIHGDAHPGNFIVNGRKVAVIDFGDAAHRDPLFDIARFFVQTDFLLKVVHGSFQPEVMDRMRALFLRQYFGRKRLTPLTRYALNVYAVENLAQIMSIQSFTKEKRYVGKVLRHFQGGVDRYVDRAVSLTY